MPYIKPVDRLQFAHVLNELLTLDTMTAGEMNYLLTAVCNSYLSIHGKRYEHINAIIGALDCAKMEFYRRIATSYEDEKIQENGDVY